MAALTDGDAPEMPSDMAWLLPPDVDEMVVGLEVRRWPNGQVGLHIVEPSMVTNAHHHLRVPRTQPAWIEIRKAGGDEETSERVLLPAEIGASLPLPMPASDGTRWSVRTLASGRFELAFPPHPAAYGFSLVTIAGTVGEPGSGRAWRRCQPDGCSGGPRVGRCASLSI